MKWPDGEFFTPLGLDFLHETLHTQIKIDLRESRKDWKALHNIEPEHFK